MVFRRNLLKTYDFWFSKETKGESQMPCAYLDLPSGLALNVKKQLVKEVAKGIHDAYKIPDTRVFLREWPAEQTSIDGELARPMRPICNFLVPPGLPVEAKRQLVKRVSSAIVEACNPLREDVPLPSGKKVSTRWVLAFFSEYPLEQAALDELMALENPMVLESLEAAMQTQQAGGRQS
jgi:phenylpyruvate tautomerase PptA (4-oxalocrotonate tautomerase family)